MMMGAGAIVQLDFSVTDRETDVFHHLAPSAFAAVAAECILTAEKTFPIQCGTGLQDVRFWGAVRLFDKDGALLRRRFLSNGVERLRVSPKGRRAVLLPQLIVIDTKSLATIGERRVATSWVDLGFVDERNALATDGRRLVSMTIPGLRETALDPLAGVSRIDALALSPGATLLAVSDGGEVGLFRRVQSRR